MSSGGNASAGTAGSAPTAGTAPSGGMGSAGVDAGGTGGSGGSGGSGGGGGSGTGSPHLFGSHKFAYAPGTILPTGSAASLDKATADFYDVWKATYLKAGCGGFYVAGGAGLDGDPGIFAVSEGEGYGMVIVPLMAGHDPDAQAAFDGLYRAFRKVPSVNDPDLAGWEMMNNSAGTCTSTTTTTDTFDDSATDGDLDTAFGLLLANAQWGSAGAINYLAEAKKVILAIKAHDVNPTSKLLMLGDWADIKAPYYATRYTATPGPYNDPASTAPQEAHPRYYWGTRPSDYMMDHLRAFQAAAADTSWSAVIDAHYALMASMQTKYSATSGLIPDFITDTDKTAAPAQGYYLEAASDGAVGYNSCRVPWHLGTDFAVTGEARAKAALAPLNAWIRKLTGDDPSKIVDGYSLAGKATGSGNEVVFVAPLGVGAMVDAKNQAWLDAIWAHVVAQKKTEYYGDTVKMLNLLVMSNNWFQP
jgi:endo-1,4-beta-D-glucanase Y